MGIFFYDPGRALDIAVAEGCFSRAIHRGQARSRACMHANAHDTESSGRGTDFRVIPVEASGLLEPRSYNKPINSPAAARRRDKERRERDREPRLPRRCARNEARHGLSKPLRGLGVGRVRNTVLETFLFRVVTFHGARDASIFEREYPVNGDTERNKGKPGEIEK